MASAGRWTRLGTASRRRGRRQWRAAHRWPVALRTRILFAEREGASARTRTTTLGPCRIGSGLWLPIYTCHMSAYGKARLTTYFSPARYNGATPPLHLSRARRAVCLAVLPRDVLGRRRFGLQGVDCSQHAHDDTIQWPGLALWLPSVHSAFAIALFRSSFLSSLSCPLFITQISRPLLA